MSAIKLTAGSGNMQHSMLEFSSLSSHRHLELAQTFEVQSHIAVDVKGCQELLMSTAVI